MSTQFNFPANPTLNQLFVLPNGATAQWNGTEWVSVSDTTIIYPLSIPLGGTAAATAAAARTNLGILGTAGVEPMTAALKLFAGTIAAPGLAFASEPGLGWYRESAGKVGMASAGFPQAIFDFSSTNSGQFVLYPRVTGEARIILQNQAQGTANLDQLHLFMRNDGAYLLTSTGGSSVQKPLSISANGINFSAGAGVIAGVPGRLLNVRQISAYGASTYTVPYGVGLIVAMLQAAGGGGGGCQGTDASTFACAGGGGGGAFCTGFLFVSGGDAKAVFLGGPGVGGGPSAGGATAATSTFIGMSAEGGHGGYVGTPRNSAAGAYFLQEDGFAGVGGAATGGNIVNAPGQSSMQAFMTTIQGGQMAGKGGVGGSGWGAPQQGSIGTIGGQNGRGFGCGGNGGSLSQSNPGGAGGSSGQPPLLLIYEYSF